MKCCVVLYFGAFSIIIKVGNLLYFLKIKYSSYHALLTKIEKKLSCQDKDNFKQRIDYMLNIDISSY